MNHKTAFFCILTFGILVFPSCKKTSTPDPLSQLPAATHSGANTLGCLVNGKAFAVTGHSSFSNPDGVDFIPYSSSSLGWLIKGNVSPAYLRISFAGNLQNSKIGRYTIADIFPFGGLYANPQNGTAILGNTEFTTNAQNNGVITVSYYDSSIIAGTFSFDAANDSGVVVHITDGRFDIRR
ncbi:MAG: hypothetical protein ABI169_07960 [Chitinophagaceae bacterium]